jgi:hypothetical protein
MRAGQRGVRPQMTTLQAFEALCGVILVCVGYRFIRAREIPVVSEGGYTPLGWLKGWEAVLAGVGVIAVGVAFIAVAAGFVQLP